MIKGISHLTFIVKDREQAATFFKTIFDAEEIYSSGDQTFSLTPEKFFLIGGLWIAVTEGSPLTDRTYNHVALKSNDEEFPLYESRIRALRVDIKPSRPRVA